MSAEKTPPSNADLSRMLQSLFEQTRSKGQSSTEYTWRSVEQVIHDQGIGIWERMLFWLSKTDLYALSYCTHHTRLSLSALGLMVLFTSMLALASSYTTLSSIIDPQIELRGMVAFVCAAIYSFGIMLIDREIVGNPSHKALWVRIVFAFFIATAVSYPIKLKLLEGAVDAEKDAMIEERNSAKIARIETLQSQGNKDKTGQTSAIDSQIEQLRSEIDQNVRIIEREATDPRLGAMCSQRCERRKAENVDKQEKVNSLVRARQQLLQSNNLPQAAVEEIDHLRSEINEEKRKGFDFLTRWQALERVLQKDKSSARVLSTFLFLFFLALELVPVGLKYSLGTSEYHQYLEARNRLNLQKLASVTNMLLEALQNAKNLEDILRLPPELSDLLAYLMEDSSARANLDDSLRQLLAAQQGNPTSAEPVQPSAPNTGDPSRPAL